MSQGTATHTITVDIKCNTEPLNQLESQLEHIAELLERIQGQHYGAGIALAIDKGSQVGISADRFKVWDSAAPLGTAIISEATVSKPKIKTSDDHIRQLIREELQQFVNRERLRGGLFSTW
ncbi:DUF1983 domain-containing protein [Xenorhabdus sp. 12]|uniref:DUF1983 domain-containing protein n=1 Tax=Xenorhabdus santafensis TaxID=2582833 RepID=A0ABU4S6G5_9GAMM|nr:DUF1983 domain-containing protein [Xenorhabdus sp. 12]MDX7986687.1 DUF1983 domain-containing protein [Xenorhabdus sp. 12]